MTTVEIESFTADEKLERCLLALARHNGNSRKAAAELAEGGIKVNHTTLWKWKTKTHAERYSQIRGEVLPLIRSHAADRHMETAEMIAKANQKAVERLGGEIDNIPARDLPGAVRNLSVATAVETEKAQLLNDQPTERRSVDLAGTLQELKSLGVEPKHVLNLEAVSEEDVPDAEEKLK